VRVKCLAQEHNTVWPGLEPGPLDPGTSALTMRPPRLPLEMKINHNFPKPDNIKHNPKNLLTNLFTSRVCSQSTLILLSTCSCMKVAYYCFIRPQLLTLLKKVPSCFCPSLFTVCLSLLPFSVNFELRWLSTVLMEHKGTTFNSFEKGSMFFFPLTIYCLLKSFTIPSGI